VVQPQNQEQEENPVVPSSGRKYSMQIEAEIQIEQVLDPQNQEQEDPG
jgi:hypothetical protein